MKSSRFASQAQRPDLPLCRTSGAKREAGIAVHAGPGLKPASHVRVFRGT